MNQSGFFNVFVQYCYENAGPPYDSESESLCSKVSESGIQDTSNVKVPSATGSGTGSQDTLNVNVPSTAASSQLVVKAVFGKVLTREEVITILNSKFMVKKSQLASLTASQLLTVLIKKLIKHSYVPLNGCNMNHLQRDDVKFTRKLRFSMPDCLKCIKHVLI